MNINFITFRVGASLTSVKIIRCHRKRFTNKIKFMSVSGFATALLINSSGGVYHQRAIRALDFPVCINHNNFVLHTCSSIRYQ